MFYIPDLQDYNRERGMYMDIDKLPGPATDDVEKLCEWLKEPEISVAAKRANYKNIKEEFESYIETENYKSILRVYNQKGMLPQSRLCAICGISNKESYLNLILSILKENKEDAEAIRKAIKHSLGT